MWKVEVMDLTQVILIGTLESDPKELEKNVNEFYAKIQVKVFRPFKDENSIYRYDIYTVKLWRGIAEDLCYIGKKGCTVVIGARLETRRIKKNGIEYQTIDIIGEKISFDPVIANVEPSKHNGLKAND